MTLKMTLVYVTLAFLSGGFLAYVWQGMRIRQVKGEVEDLTAALADSTANFEEAWDARYEAGITDALAKVREKRSDTMKDVWKRRNAKKALEEVADVA